MHLREQYLSEPFVRGERFTQHGVRKNIAQGDEMIVEDITADGDMPAQVTISVDHARARHQHTKKGADP